MNCCWWIIILWLLGNGNSFCGNTCQTNGNTCGNVCNNTCNNNWGNTCGNSCVEPRRSPRNVCDLDCDDKADTFNNNRFSMYNTENNDCGCRN